MKAGIAGAGMIVPTFLAAEKQIPELEAAVICGTVRSKDKAEKLAKEHGIPQVYCDYDKMLACPELHVIYVAVPNHLHASFVRRALLAGKSVICEKPLCSSLAEAEALALLAREKGLYLFEAITNQYFPNYQKVKELLPRLGRVKIVEINYSQYSSRYDAFRAGEILPVFDPKKSGGALMDLNVYNIHFILGLFGEPEEVRYFANMEQDVDTSGVLVLRYPGFVCTAIAAKDCKAPCCINIQGDQGCITSDSPSNVFERFRFSENRGPDQLYELNEERERFYYELRAFLQMVKTQDRRFHEEQLQRSLAVQRILDEARRQADMEILSDLS